MITLLLRTVGQMLRGGVAAVLQLLFSLVLVVMAIAAMIAATLVFGVWGLVAVATPIIVGLFVWGYVTGGSEGSSSGD
jgi:hypothetical protein